MNEGVFTNKTFVGPSLSGNDLSLFKSILGIKFDTSEALSYNAHSRQRLLDILIAYYELHLVGFRKPKSIQVLKKLFS